MNEYMPKQSQLHPNVWVFDHPVIQDKLTRIREKTTNHTEFRRLLNEIAGLMCFQLSRNFQTQVVNIHTPVQKTQGYRLSQPVTLVPVLRAGIGMTEGILQMIPEARVGHIGVYRNEETKEPVPYYCKVPQDISTGPVFLIDPMLATGGSASYAATVLSNEYHCKNLQMVCLVCAPNGVEKLQSDHPTMKIFTASIDEGLNENSYIVPGLGDAGDRIFGTI